MPYAAPRPCPYPGCGVLVGGGGYCPPHKKAKQRLVEANRESSTARGYGRPWQKARAGYLRKNPLCIQCQELGKMTAATDVDHIEPHRGDKTLFWDSANWQALCHPCHSAKTAREDGGFGNARGDAASLG